MQQMMPQQRKARNIQRKRRRKTKPRGRTLFPGICEHARALGVNRASLYRVLTGEWSLPTLKARYEQLIAKEGGK